MRAPFGGGDLVFLVFDLRFESLLFFQRLRMLRFQCAGIGHGNGAHCSARMRSRRLAPGQIGTHRRFGQTRCFGICFERETFAARHAQHGFQVRARIVFPLRALIDLFGFLLPNLPGLQRLLRAGLRGVELGAQGIAAGLRVRQLVSGGGALLRRSAQRCTGLGEPGAGTGFGNPLTRRRCLIVMPRRARLLQRCAQARRIRTGLFGVQLLLQCLKFAQLCGVRGARPGMPRGEFGKLEPHGGGRVGGTLAFRARGGNGLVMAVRSILFVQHCGAPAGRLLLQLFELNV